MEKISIKLSEHLVKKGMPCENKEIYAYALECLMNVALIFSIMLIVGAVLHQLFTTIVWIAFFLPLRHSSGGLHANSHKSCFILSLAIGIGCMVINPFLNMFAWPLFAGVVFSIVVIFLFAPIIHPNHPISDARIHAIKIFARIIVIIESVSIIMLYLVSLHALSWAALLGMLSATSSTLIGRFWHQNN